MKSNLCCLFIALFSSVSVCASEQRSLKSCQYIKEQIEYYTNLKRAGGSASQMANWQKQRNKYKLDFSEYNCKIYRGKFK